MRYFKMLLILIVISNHNIKCQTSYVGGAASFRLISENTNTGMFQNSSNTQMSLLLSPEYGILKDNGNMFGLSIGAYYTRRNNQVNVNALFAAVFGFNYRRLLGDKALRPLVETGLQAFIGQENPTSQGQEFFSGVIPVRAGILYEFLPQWNVITTIDVLGLNYTRRGNTTMTNLHLANNSMINFSVLRTF